MLDSASTFNAKMAAREQSGAQPGYFSHTAVVPRYGNSRPPPDHDEYITSESYESDHYNSDQRQQHSGRSRYILPTAILLLLNLETYSNQIIHI